MYMFLYMYQQSQHDVMFDIQYTNQYPHDAHNVIDLKAA